MRFNFSKLIWGAFLLLVAALIVLNQINGFADIGIFSVIAAVLSLAAVVQCVARLHFAALPIPLAVLYIIFQQPLGLPYIKIWEMVLASVLASMGLAALLPRRRRRECYDGRDCYQTSDRGPQVRQTRQTRPESSGDDGNNPSISVNFGSIDRSLHADCLETARLSCNFGALKLFFDQVSPRPSGAEAIINCSFGGIELLVPRHWRVIDNLNCSLGGVSIDKNFAATLDAPKLTLTGSVSLGGVDVRCI
ncbi:hypothetical protein R80B4_02124 [Fibrobacteres bacterium R8-0-B4]